MLQFHFASVEIRNYTEQYESVRCWFKTQSLVTIKIGKKTRKREKRNNNWSHDWTKKAPKPAAKLNGSTKLLRSERPRIIFWKSLPTIGSKMWYRFDVSWKTVVFIVQSGLKLYNFSIAAARVETSTKRSGSRFRDRGRNVVQQQWQKKWENDNSTYFALHSILFEHLELLEHRATSSAGTTMFFV